MTDPSTTRSLGSLDTAWDVIVIGAGPAGVLSSILALRNGWKTLLVEAKHFPRAKVCGGCLNGRAQQVLEDHGLLDLILEAGAVPLHGFQLVQGKQRGHWGLPNMLSISRSTMDDRLVRRARDEGVEVSMGTTATIGAIEEDRRRVLLSRGHEKVSVCGSVIVAASGLVSSCLSGFTELESHVAPGARIGVGAVMARPSSPLYASSDLWMAVGKEGYVGMAPVESDQWNVAAALDSRSIRERGSIGDVIVDLLEQCQLPIPDNMGSVTWTGTPALTRQRMRVAMERLFLVGDATGYVEPFTGEGMAWALLEADRLGPWVDAGCREWKPSFEAEWQRCMEIEVRKRQWFWRGLTQILRSPWLSNVALRTTRWFPGVADRAIRYVVGSESTS